MTKFTLGSKVRLKTERDRIGIIESGPKMLASINWYRIRFLSGEARNVEEDNLECFEGQKDVLDLFYDNSYSKKETFSKLITYTELHKPLHNYLYSFRSSRTEFYAFQFKPLIKFLDSQQQRILIADEVGLGKTIEAGFILNELKARHPSSLKRVLIVCPSALRFKWKEEMERRFSEEFQIMNSMGFMEFLYRFSEYGEMVKLRGICSLQTLRSRGILEQLQEISAPLDLTIIDEAHHMRNVGTLSYRLGEFLSSYSDAMVMLTATPIHLGNENLFNLLRILDQENFGNLQIFDERLKANEHVVAAGRILRGSFPADFSSTLKAIKGVENTSEREYFQNNPVYQDLIKKLQSYDENKMEDVIELQGKIENLNLMGNILTRSRKVDVYENRSLRRPSVVRPQFSSAEMDFYNAVTNFIINRNIKNKKNPICVFQTIMIQRQMASCIPASVEHIRNKYKLDEYIEEEEEVSDIAPEDILIGDEKDNDKFEMKELYGAMNELIALSNNVVKVDSKFDALVELLDMLKEEEPYRKIMLFSYFKKTIKYLEKRLRVLGYKCVLISGDVPSVPTNPLKDERKKRLDQFKNELDTRILLSTEVGSEGLDFQFCHTMINYDLPWNPMVVEQRIGRLDRIGQKSDKILIYNFSIPGTIEDRMLERLYKRIRIFEESIGDLEAILGEEMQKLVWEFFTNYLTSDEQNERIAQTAQVIERKRQNLLDLEKNSKKLIGEDTFFSDAIERKRKDKLFLSAKEIEVFVREFIEMEFPRSAIKESEEKGLRIFKVCSDLENFARDKYKKDDHLLQQFLIKIHNGELQVTFDSDYAYQNQEVEFLNFYHPIVNSIVKHYEEHQEKLHPVAMMTLSNSKFDTDEYFYFIFVVEMTSMKSSRDFEPIIISRSTNNVLARETGWDMFVSLITDADTMEHMPCYDKDELETVYSNAEKEFEKRITSKKDKMSKINEDIANSRLESIKRSYDVKIIKKEQMLNNAIKKQQDQRIIRMHEGARRNLEAACKAKIAELEGKKRLGIKFDLIAAGVVEVT